MNAYSRITYFENKRRIGLLEKFKIAFINWDCTVDKDFPETTENDASTPFRTEINLILNEVDDVILQSGKSSYLYYQSPQLTGGIQGNVNVVMNVFRLFSLKLPKETLLDIVDQSLGIYKKNNISSFFRTINPFYWITELSYFILATPLSLVSQAFRMPIDKIENSIIVKILRLVTNLALVIIAILSGLKTMYPSLDLEPIRNFFI